MCDEFLHLFSRQRAVNVAKRAVDNILNTNRVYFDYTGLRIGNKLDA